MAHDLAHRDVREVEDTAEHAPLVADVLVVAAVHFDGAAQLLLMGLDLGRGCRPIADGPERAAHDPLDRPRRRAEDPDHHRDGRRHRRGNPVRMVERVGLRGDFGEDQDHQGHRHRGVGNPGLPEQSDEQARGERGGKDVDQVVAEQEGGDQPLLIGAQPPHGGGALVAAPRTVVHPAATDRDQRGLRAGEERRQDDQGQYGGKCDPGFHAHR